jgi:diaminopimelate decarboxylase
LLDGVSLAQVARETGTPAYVYALDAICAEARDLHASFDGMTHLVAYAVKANSAGSIVRALAAEGCGADVVSGAELRVAFACGIAPERIVYSGVAKQNDELDLAIKSGAFGIGAIQIESIEEIARVAARGEAAGRAARVSVRVNPGMDLTEATHAHIATGHDSAKFGVALADVGRAVELIENSPWLRLVGMATHVGSQFTRTDPYVAAARVLFGLVGELRAAGRGRAMTFVDTGGGFGIDQETTDLDSAAPGAAEARDSFPRPGDFVRAVMVEQSRLGASDLALYVEPGRSLVAAHGVLVASVIQSKLGASARWLMIDAGMNDLVRPALYQARHRIVPIDRGIEVGSAIRWRVVGPVCESADDFGTHLFAREPPDQVAILDAGAYGYTMASHYNGRQLPVEAFVKGGVIVGRTSRPSVEAWVRERANAGER